MPEVDRRQGCSRSWKRPSFSASLPWPKLLPRYGPAYTVRHDWKQFAERLGPKQSANDTEHCGYSTNPAYAAQLIKIVETCHLYDHRAQEWLETGKDPGPILEAMLS
jgi:hypothetical protein